MVTERFLVLDPAAMPGEMRAHHPAMDARDLEKSFGPIVALKSVSLAIERGQIHAICGENGAGKSTLVKILTGVYEADGGTIAIDGERRSITSPKSAEALGIAFVSQELSLCPHLSVGDNIWLGSGRVPLFHRRKHLSTKARDALDIVGLSHIGLDRLVTELGMGERQLVEIARMLTRDAKILFLDEPTATLSDSEIGRIFRALLALKREGRSVVYITHRLGEVFEICDVVTVLRNGELVETRSVSDLTRAELIESMLGRSHSDMYPDSVALAAAASGLTVDRLTCRGLVSPFSLSVARGMIACIAGQVGSGATEVCDALAGLDYTAAGQVSVNSRRLELGSPERALAANVMFISGDRANEGIFQNLSIFENLVATRLGYYSSLGVLRRKALVDIARGLADRLHVDVRRLRAPASTLSGGNQQKLAFGRCIGDRPDGIIVMNEPTRGIDIGARADIYRIMREICAQGYTLVMMSSDLEEIIGIADMVTTMYRGRQVNTYQRGEFTGHQLLADITHPDPIVVT